VGPDRGAQSCTTTLLTTQHLEEADRLADEIVVIDHGKVIARGTGPALKQQVGADTVDIVVSDPSGADGVVSALSSLACGAAITEPHEDGRRTVVRIPVTKVDGLTPTVVRMLDTAGVQYADVAGRQSTLDDVFFALTGHPTEDPSLPSTGTKAGSTTRPKGGHP
jgi:ABC-2 type transport system ATP-binding protein